jgi:uncharacterized membrane protein (UPF0136 family)
MNPLFAQITVGIVSVLVLVGGVMGFVKGKSKPSLIAGLVSSILLDIGLALSFSNMQLGLGLCDVVSFALFIVGTIRFRKTKKIMPGGLIVILAGISLIVVTLTLVRK